MPKYLFTFEKGESVRWLGHLDILRTFERAIRRAGLPIAFSTGFNPRERLAFASALSVGVTGAAELATLELTDPLEPDCILTRLNAVLPPGLPLRTCQEIPDAGARDLLNSFDRAEYEVTCACSGETQAEQVRQAIESLLAQSELNVTREREGRTKTLNIRPFLFSLSLLPDSLGKERLKLHFIVSLGESGNVRPNEVVTLLAASLPGLTLRRSHRVRLLQTHLSRKEVNL